MYSFATNIPQSAVSDGGTLTCSFDSIDENCAWYSITFDNSKKINYFIEDNEISSSLSQNVVNFHRARFESLLFDLKKFKCTNERLFIFGFF